MTINNLRNLTNMTQKEFGEYLNIPIRTIQNWESEHRKPPEYVTELIEYKIKKEKLNMKKLVELKEGKRTELFEGTLEEMVTFLKKNTDIYNWQLDEDENAEQPNLDEVYDWEDLEYEFDKISLGWWDLAVE